MGLFKSDPPPIDYAGAAEAQGEASKDVTNMQTWANRPIQQNPWGTVNWDVQAVTNPADPNGEKMTQWMQTTNLADPLNRALWDQMNMQATRSAIAGGMMGGLAGQYFKPELDANGNPVMEDYQTQKLDANGQPVLETAQRQKMQYNLPDWEQAGGMMMPNAPQQMHLNAMPARWGHLQWDIPQYQTTGQVRQLNYGQLPGVDAPEWTQQRAEQAYYDRLNQRLQPQFESEQQALEIKMRNQGLVPGDEAWQAQMQSFNNRKTDAYQSALNESLMAGGTEAERMFGMQTGRRGMFAGELQDLGQFANQAAMNDFQQRMAAGSQGFQDTLSAAQFQNQARQGAFQERMGMMDYNQQQAYQYADYYNQIRQQQLNEYLTQRGFTLNEIQALLNNQQVGLPQFNQFNTAQRADPTQYLAAAQLQGQQNAANASADNAFMNNLIGGASTLGAAGISAGMFSDRRLKSDITKIGVRNGVNWYHYTIGGQPQIGVMADEVPWAAFEHPSGFLMVDYRRV